MKTAAVQDWPTIRTVKDVRVFLGYPTRDGHFVLSTDASDTGMGAVLEEEQEDGGRVVKRVIA